LREHEADILEGTGDKMDTNNRRKLLLFDLDDTLLRSDKLISQRTLEALRKCREKGILIGISTSRSVHNCMAFLAELTPDLFIASGGAVIEYQGKNIYTAEFSIEDTQKMIRTAREICGAECEITIDTLDAHYWNYKVDPKETDATWGDTVYTDYSDYTEKALKFCVEIFDDTIAKKLADSLSDCDCQRFAGTVWYKFTKKEATKETAILKACEICGIALEDVIALGDDTPDIDMLKLCGIGVAMGNALDSVKEAADVVIGNNDEDGIAKYLELLAI